MAKTSGRIRIKGTGRYARVLCVPAGIAFVAIALNVNNIESDDPEWMRIIPIALGLWFGYAGLRSLFLGVWIDDEKLTARTWFRNRSWARGDLLDASSMPYWGGFTGGWQSHALRELMVTDADREQHDLSGTIAFRRKSELQREQIRAFIDGTAPADTLAEARERLIVLRETPGKHVAEPIDG